MGGEICWKNWRCNTFFLLDRLIFLTQLQFLVTGTRQFRVRTNDKYWNCTHTRYKRESRACGSFMSLSWEDEAISRPLTRDIDPFSVLVKATFPKLDTTLQTHVQYNVDDHILCCWVASPEVNHGFHVSPKLVPWSARKGLGCILATANVPKGNHPEKQCEWIIF